MALVQKTVVVQPSWPVCTCLYTLLFGLLLCVSCARVNRQVQHIKVKPLQGEAPIALRKLLNKKINVLVVLGTECPICIKYTRTLTDLTRTFPDVAWLGVFNRWEDSLAVGQFVENYKIPFPVVLDPQQVLIQQLDAHVTPEVFVLDQKCRILYRGAIDNWFYELGKRRSVITENFLVDALEATQQGKPLLIKATKPVGCVFN